MARPPAHGRTQGADGRPSSPRHHLAAGLLTGLLAICACSLSAADHPPDDTVDATHREEDMLILSVNLGTRGLHEGLVAYTDGDRVRVPLFELCRTLGIDVEGDADAGVASGWFRDEAWRFELDLSRRLLALGGRETPLDAQRIVTRDGDLYVPVEWFGAWFDLAIDVQLGSARLYLREGQRLPLEEKLARTRRWEALTRTRDAPGERLPLFRPPPVWIAWPAIDASVSHASEQGQASSRASVLATGDALFGEGRLSVDAQHGGAQPGSVDVRLLWQRRGPPEQGRDWSAGDIVAPGIPLLSDPTEGVGVLFGPSDEQPANDGFRTELRGEALNGWDVELYRNGELVAFLTVSSDNRYRFENVALQPGTNLFRIVHHGPQGQRRERLQRIAVGEGMLVAGTHRWQAFALRPGDRLWTPTDATADARDLPDGARMFAIGHRHAPRTGWLLSTDLLAAPSHRRASQRYLSLRNQIGLGGWLLDLQWAGDGDGGASMRGSLQVSGARDNVGLDYTRHRDFDMPATSGTRDARPLDRLDLRWNSRLLPALPFTLEFERQREREGSVLPRETRTARLRMSRRLGPMHVGMNGELRRETGRPDQAGLGTLLNLHRPRFELSAQGAWGFAPEAGLRSANLSLQWRIGESLRLRTQAQRSRGVTDRLDLALAWSARRWQVNLGAGIDREGRWRCGVNLFTSLQRTPSGWRFDRRASTASTSAVAHAFLDVDGDGRQGPGETAVADIGFRAQTSGAVSRTDASGHALLTDLPARRPVTIRLQEQTLENPFWIATAPAQQVQASPGRITTLVFPIVPSVEIDGTVWLRRDNGRVPAKGMRLQLLAADGRQIREILSGSDGGYFIDRLPPGAYRLRIDPAQAGRLRLSAGHFRDLRLGGPDAETATVDWELAPAPEPAPESEPAPKTLDAPPPNP